MIGLIMGQVCVYFYTYRKLKKDFKLYNLFFSGLLSKIVIGNVGEVV